MIKKLLLLFCCIITSCGINCIEPWSGVSSSSIEIEVPPKVKRGSAASYYWVDSGESISADQTLKMTVSGAINLCPKDSSNPKNVIVPAVFCSDGAIPEYSDSNDGADPKKICKSHGGWFSSKGRYVDTGLSVNPGDILNFSLIPRKITINDCKKLPPGVIIDGPNVYYRDKDGKEPVSSVDVCRSGGNYYMKGDDGRIYEARDEKGNSIGSMKFESLQGREFDVLVGDGFTPYDNKVHLSTDNFKNPNRGKGYSIWEKGALLDLRNVKPDLNNNICKKYGRIQKLDSVAEKFSAYDLNCFCSNICYNQGPWASDSGISSDKNCISSIRHKFKGNGKCSLNTEDLDLNEYNFTTSWAELLIARIDQSKSEEWNINARQCLPEGTGQCINYNRSLSDFKKLSLQLNHNYVVGNVEKNSPLMLGIADTSKNEYDNNIGGYYVKVQRTCPLADGKKLYMYISDTSPTMLPGESGTFPICESDNCSGVYEINTDNNPKTGKIYFGIDTRGVQDEQFIDVSQEFVSANKYVINVFRTKWNPIFSNFFISIRDAILNVLYGAPASTGNRDISSAINSSQGGTIRQIYNNYSTSKPFWDGVRALFVLYIAFSAIGYVLGLIQLSKFDLSIRILKIAFVIMIFSPNSWEFFSTHFFALFTQGVNQLITAFSGYLEADDSFRFLDPTVGVLLAGDTWLRFLSLFFAGPIGWLVFLMIMWGSFSFFACILEAMLMYFMMIISTSFLLSLSPVFFTFILFQKTKQLFDGWIKLLLNFSIQPIILFAALAFLNQALLSILYTITNFTACPRCIGEFKIYKDEEGSICLFEVLLPGGFSNDLSFTERMRENERGNSLDFFGLPFSITAVLLYLIIANAMRGFARVAESIALSISGTLSNMIGHRGAAVDNASQALLSLVGLDRDTKQIINSVRNRPTISQRPVRFEGSDANVSPRYQSENLNESSEPTENLEPKNRATEADIKRNRSNRMANEDPLSKNSGRDNKETQSGNESDEVSSDRESSE
ncbi:type IV secretion system protein [Candidatus Mesenet endosymbiont of Phosphuga atrata]|uniref:type IV secretion system protein n=1 Tax=Candidatus Mesenet endosymbiont of Phosphuga atrata TaxID=3066221 RepID=UPI0030D3347F